MSREDDILPPRLWEAETHGPAKGMKSFIDQDDFERSLDKYYELRGWGKDGVPKEETIKKLGLNTLVS